MNYAFGAFGAFTKLRSFVNVLLPQYAQYEP
ncbi:MAG: hypothetical protein ACI9XB_004300 [Gammaproteobacteria bacterium]|jgi:hypothetical protein